MGGTCSRLLISWSKGELGRLPSASGLGSSAFSSLICCGNVLVCLHHGRIDSRAGPARLLPTSQMQKSQ